MAPGFTSARKAALWVMLLWLARPAVATGEVALQIVAHQDDDLYFINPAVDQSIDRGDPTWTVHVTAGDASRRLPQPPAGSTACDFVTYHWQDPLYTRSSLCVQIPDSGRLAVAGRDGYLLRISRG